MWRVVITQDQGYSLYLPYLPREPTPAPHLLRTRAHDTRDTRTARARHAPPADLQSEVEAEGDSPILLSLIEAKGVVPRDGDVLPVREEE